jgi:hypothetical protein
VPDGTSLRARQSGELQPPRPNTTPFTATTPRQSLTQVNPANAPMAAQSARMDFSNADLAPEQELNQAIWESVKGAASPMPKPVNGGSDTDH